MPINIDDTRTMLAAIERSVKPTTTLIDTFFPDVQTFVTETVDIEYRKGGRKMAPFVVPGTKGVNLARTGSKIRTYKVPVMKPKRPALTPTMGVPKGARERATPNMVPSPPNTTAKSQSSPSSARVYPLLPARSPKVLALRSSRKTSAPVLRTT